jgi:hypothetical protein
MTPPERLGDPTVVIAERAHWAHNWAAREMLRDVVTIGTDGVRGDVLLHLRGVPQGVTVHVLGGTPLPPSVREFLRVIDANVVDHPYAAEPEWHDHG